MQSSERRRRKEWAGDDEVQERFALEVLKMRSAVRGGKEESAGKDTSTSTRAVVEDNKFMKNFYVSKEAIAMSKAAVFPIIIRRTKRSKQLDGQKIINLKPFTESIVWVNLTAEEMAAIETIGAKFQGDNTNVVCTNFLIEFKKISLHLGLGQHGDRFWESWTVETLEAVISSKVRAVTDIVGHHQNPAAGPMIWRREDGQRDLAAEAEAALDFHPASRPRKFLILAVYECHCAILKKVFDLKSWTYREYEGTMTPAQRRRAISEFENDKSIMILLISNVGTTGLNITRASIGILMGGLWAAAEEDQTAGRLNRMGQLEAGVIYKVLARGTADEVLSGCANGKGMMGEFLFSKEMEWIDDDPDSDDESDKPATLKPRKSAIRGRKPKQVNPDQADGDGNGDLPVPPKQSQSGKRKQGETDQGDGDGEPPAPAKKP
ncbi:hypothetical protein FRC08_016795 [Ceratobasidium sp. 394]|nr:hypothetical protein FRC08_016795 [Ceratobasidium sp. 394]